MRIDWAAVARNLVLAIWLLAPLGLGVVLVHTEFDRWAEDPTYWMLKATVVVLWLYGLIEAKSKHGWAELTVVALTLPLFYVLLMYGTPMPMSERNYTSPMAFFPWVAVMSLVSAHLYGRRIFCAFGACLLVTAFVTSYWYEETVLWRLRWMFG